MDLQPRIVLTLGSLVTGRVKVRFRSSRLAHVVHLTEALATETSIALRTREAIGVNGVGNLLSRATAKFVTLATGSVVDLSRLYHPPVLRHEKVAVPGPTTDLEIVDNLLRGVKVALKMVLDPHDASSRSGHRSTVPQLHRSWTASGEARCDPMHQRNHPRQLAIRATPHPQLLHLPCQPLDRN